MFVIKDISIVMQASLLTVTKNSTRYIAKSQAFTDTMITLDPALGFAPDPV